MNEVIWGYQHGMIVVLTYDGKMSPLLSLTLQREISR